MWGFSQNGELEKHSEEKFSRSFYDARPCNRFDLVDSYQLVLARDKIGAIAQSGSISSFVPLDQREGNNDFGGAL